MTENKLKRIEEIEFQYFNTISKHLTSNIYTILEGFKSKNEIKSDWFEIFKKTARDGYNNSSELDIGAERILYDLFGKLREFKPNSCPIGSDLMFSDNNAIIHIEVKSATDSNSADFKGKIQLGQNQTSYSVEKNYRGEDYPFKASLPTTYSNHKICLTYAIQIIHNPNDDYPKIIVLFSIPNGELKPIYENCVNSGKHQKELNRLASKGDIRFKYNIANKFTLLKDTPPRIKIIYPSPANQNLVEKYLGKGVL